MKDIFISVIIFAIFVFIFTYTGVKKEMQKMQTAAAQALADSSAIAGTDTLATDTLQTEATSQQTINELSQATDGLDQDTSTTDTEEVKNYKNLAKIYEKMDPATAAKILNKFTPDDVSAILFYMKERQAAQIFSQLDPNFAVLVSQEMLKLKKKS